MPVTVRHGSGSRPWKIVEKSSGKVVGTSTSKAKAEASARARNAHHYSHGTWRPTKGR
jgi:hypothetical protein